MADKAKAVETYQLRVCLQGVSPLVWRRLLVRSDSTIADLHHTLQIVMNWDDEYLHHFLIRSKRYGIARIGTFGFLDNAYRVRLDRFHLRPREKFLYTYNYYADWQLELRFENRFPLDDRQSYPVCLAGKRAAPRDDDGGPEAFLAFRHRYFLWEIGERLLAIAEAEDLVENIDDYRDEVRIYDRWLNLDQFDRRETNRRLRAFFGKRRRDDGHEGADSGGD